MKTGTKSRTALLSQCVCRQSTFKSLTAFLLTIQTSMNKTSTFNGLTQHKKITITTNALQELLDCGRQTAVNIGDAAGARVQIGKRLLWNVEKVKLYVDSISV